MTSRLIVVGGEVPIGVTARLMLRHGVRHVLVVDHDGALLGVAGDAQVFSRGALTGTNQELWVSYDGTNPSSHDVADRAELVVEPDDSLHATLSALLSSGSDVAVVVDKAQIPVGVLTEHDGVRIAREWLDAGVRVTASSLPLHALPHSAGSQDALAMMTAVRVRHLVVMQRGELMGVISLRDLVEDGVMGGSNPELGRVLRSRDTHTIDEGASMVAAAEQMETFHVGCLPVMVEGRVAAMITRSDCIAVAVAMMLVGDNS